MPDAIHLATYFTIGLGVVFIVITFIAYLRMKIFTVRAPKKPAFCDLIDYATKADRNVYMMKSGALLSMYEVVIPDMSTLTDEQVEAIYVQAQMALLKCGPNYSIQFDAARFEVSDYIPKLATANPVLCDIEERKAQLFRQEGSFVTKLYFSVTYMGERENMHVLQRTLVSSEHEEYDDDGKTEQIIKNFRANCDVVVDALNLSFKVKPLGIREKDVSKLYNHHLRDRDR